MRSLVLHELRRGMRRAAWPLALGLHLVGVTLFVAVWGPTGGVPLWAAPLLTQLVAADRMLLAVLLTWLVTPLFAHDAHADLVGWSGVTGISVRSLMASRAIAASLLAIMMVLSGVPIVAAASQISSVPLAGLAGTSLEMLSFSLLAVGLVAAASIAWRRQVAVWCGGMLLTTAAAFAARMWTPGTLRVAVCLLVAATGMAAATTTVIRRSTWIDEARP
jgi:hypothetical protein